jgi:hypothetical protein
MPFCPECQSEYQAGITRCEEHDRELVSQLTADNLVHDNSEAKMVELRSFSNFTEAEMVEEVLQQNNIRMLLQGQEAGGGVFPTASTGPILLVDERDLARAQELVDAYFEAEIVEGDLAEEAEKGQSNG